MAEVLPASLFAEWQAYAVLEPFGPPADFFCAGVVASAVHNVQRTKESDPVALPHDFYPKEFHQAVKQTLVQDYDNAGVLDDFAARRQAWEARRRG